MAGLADISLYSLINTNTNFGHSDFTTETASTFPFSLTCGILQYGWSLAKLVEKRLEILVQFFFYDLHLLSVLGLP